jgi:hypothetical protein
LTVNFATSNIAKLHATIQAHLACLTTNFGNSK